MEGDSAPGQADKAGPCPVDPAPRKARRLSSWVAWATAGKGTSRTRLLAYRTVCD